MKLQHLPLAETGLFSALLRNYLQGQLELRELYSHGPDAQGVSAAMASHDLEVEARAVLVAALQKQYAQTPHSPSTAQNIQRLAHKGSFTITTGHQLNIFTGPLFFIYKIVSVIKACQRMEALQPGKHFIPVYWMATEDHDLDEISHFQVFGKTYTWTTHQQGPVGRMHTRGLAEIAQELPEAVPLFEEAYAQSANLAEATRRIVTGLFDQYGVVCVDGDDTALKQSFIPVIKSELLEGKSGKIVDDYSAKLEALGYKAQVFPRDINLFYMLDGFRERIVQTSGGYEALNSSYSWTTEALLQEVDTHPERFSPNVVLRPLYQQLILPNVAYIGGPAEVAYWLQLKGVFNAYQVSYPTVLPRNFVLWTPKSLYKKVEQLGVEWKDLLHGFDAMKEAFLAKEGFEAPDTSAQHEAVRKAYEEMVQIAQDFDASLKGFIQAEESRALKSLDTISKRLTKAAESRMEVSLRQLHNLRERLFPGGAPQERVDNYLSIALNQPDFISILVAHLDAFDQRYYLFAEDE